MLGNQSYTVRLLIRFAPSHSARYQFHLQLYWVHHSVWSSVYVPCYVYHNYSGTVQYSSTDSGDSGALLPLHMIVGVCVYKVGEQL